MSKILFEKLLADFKKSNSARKEKIIAKAGYSSNEEYIAHLQKQISLWDRLPEGISETVEKSSAPLS